ncbi:MAG: tryptophan synthase subunit alpha [Candidatus Omnitrophica bacterium]|nr:tryptophan synthase subunit alpha [Candidatus Omnitrophota bacterium]
MTIQQRFDQLMKEKRSGLIAYITAGCPDLAFTQEFALRLQDAGVDFIEIGVPFSDPIADGPVLQQASQKALEGRTNLQSIFKLCGKLEKSLSIPYLLMTYFNPVFRYGLKDFARDCCENGVSGVIVPDLPFEESNDFRLELEKYGVEQILFISSTTSTQRRKKILEAAKGFIYYIAVCGVTGMREFLPEETYQDVANLRKVSKVPVAVGFGISNAEQVRRLKSCADAIIIGSFVMQEIMAGNYEMLLETIKNFRNILREE